MSEAEKQEGQKTVVSFIAGLLIGGLLVWVFGGNTADDSDGAIVDTGGAEEVSDEERVTDEAMSDDDEVMVEDTAASDTQQPELQTGEAAISVEDQAAGRSVTVGSATFPNDDGWIAVRSYDNDQMGNILGAARFSKEQNLVPESIQLLTPTVAGQTYAVVFFTEDGNRTFNLSGDVQVEGVWETFTAE